jgi:hypothetical protein
MDGIMQSNKKSKKDIIEKLRMILDDPNIKHESLNDKNLIRLQKKLKKPSYENISFSKKKYEQIDESDDRDPLRPSVKIHRMESEYTFEHKEEKSKIVEFQEVDDENPFKDEELYEIELIDEEVPEFIEIKDENKLEKDLTHKVSSESKDGEDSFDNLPNWETVESEDTEVPKFKDEKAANEEIPEWEPITNEQFKGKKVKITEKAITKDEDDIVIDKDIDRFSVFSTIKSIDEKVAELLLDNGYNSIDDLKDVTLKDLTKIKGIKRKIAKKIKKDIKTHFDILENPEFEAIDHDLSDEDFEKNVDHEKSDKEILGKLTDDGFFEYGEYSLYRKEIILQSDKKRIIHFFSKGKPDDGEQVSLPDGYEVKINKKTGVPYISRKK